MVSELILVGKLRCIDNWAVSDLLIDLKYPRIVKMCINSHTFVY